jgi:pimeloyl-ACP methyl ester carboxylesterase
VTGAIKGWDVRDRLKEIEIPTLVIRGRHDMCTDPIAETLVKGIPNSRGVVLEESSHTPCLEQSDEYLAAISKFMKQAETM